MTESLKSCPFCGGKVRLESSHGLNYVLCKKCKSEYYPASFGDEKKAVSAWNKRSIEDKIYKKIDKLEAENKMLVVALGDIKKVVENKQDKQNPSHFDLDAKDAVFILDTIENALLWSPK